MMLPPFRIRNLRESSRLADTNDHGGHSTELGAQDQHGIVQVSAPEYDATISTHPEATLKYMDEDDGEVITVGSSLELAQRLEEPITPVSRSSTRSPPFLYPAMRRPANPRLSTTSPPLHTFDIGRTSVALSLWSTIERRARRESSSGIYMTAAPDWSRPLLVDLPNQALYKGKVESSTTDSKMTLSEDPREHYFNLTDPPHLARKGGRDPFPATESTLTDIEHSHEECPQMANALLRSHRLELAELTREWGSLSSEGRKQAEQAGLKLGCSIKRPMSHSPPEIPQKKAHQDRWAAYSRLNPDPQLQDIIPPSENSPHGADEPGEPHRPLLEVFEAELAKLLSDGSVGCADETNQTLEPQPRPATEALAPQTTSDPPASDINNQEAYESPVKLFGQAVRGFIDEIGLLTSEVRSIIPEAHEQLLSAQQNLPRAFQQTVLGAIHGWGSHVHRIANNVQLASIATRNAADRTRALDTQALQGVVSGLHGLAVGIGDIGGALFPGMTHGSAATPSEGQTEHAPNFMLPAAEAINAAAELAHQTDATAIDERQTSDVAATPSGACRNEDFTPSSLASTPAGNTSDGRLGHARSKYTDGEYEKIHRTKREEAANRRDADRQRVRRMQQEADEAYSPSDASTCFTGQERQTDKVNVSNPVQAEEQHDRLRNTRAPEATTTNADKGTYFSKPYCLFGCTSSPSCRHRRASGGSPYPLRNDFHRSRHTRRSSLHYSSQLPYEYVVPPPEFYETTDSTPASNPSRYSGGRSYARSRLPATGLREPSPDTNMSPSDWPKAQRYGPIHLPHDARRPSDDTWMSQLPHSRSPRSRSPPPRWPQLRSPPLRQPTPEFPPMDRRSPRPQQPSPESSLVQPRSQAPRQPSPEMLWVDPRSKSPRQPASEAPWAKPRVAATPAAYCPSSSQCNLIPAAWVEAPASSRNDVGHHTPPLRHRQSWHPSSATKTPERWNMTRPERPSVSFAEPNGVSPLPSWNRVLENRKSAGLFTTPGTPYSTTRDHPVPVSGVQAKETQPNGQMKLPNSAYPGYRYPHTEKMKEATKCDDLEFERVGRDLFELNNLRASVNLPRIHTPNPRHPLPVKRSDRLTRAATVGHSNRRKEHDVSSKPTRLSSVLDSLPPEVTAPELKRFPTLAQFENDASKTLPPFPPLPTMEPLIPVCTDVKANGASTGKGAAKTEKESEVNTRRSSCSDGRSTLADTVETSESSGQFFRRMTGLGAPPVEAQDSGPHFQPIRPAKLKLEQGEARLTRPFDPLAESVTLHRSRLIDNFRRTTTERGSFQDHYAGNRRPYSEYFTGNGRLGWESFLAKQNGASARLPPTRNHATSNVASDKAVDSQTSASTAPSGASINPPTEHHDAQTVGKVQECVDQLSSLGFGTEENGGMARLLVYAQAAEGNLEDAIETIEEERKAYEQRISD